MFSGYVAVSAIMPTVEIVASQIHHFQLTVSIAKRVRFHEQETQACMCGTKIVFMFPDHHQFDKPNLTSYGPANALNHGLRHG